MNRVPPASVQAENAVIGCCLLHPYAVETALDLLCSDDFYDPHNRARFAVIARAYEHGQPIDPLSVALQLGESQSALRELQAEAPLTGSVRHFAERVAEDAACRRAITFAENVEDAAFARNTDQLNALFADPLSTILPMFETSTEPLEAKELAAVSQKERAWLIPRLIARQEVVLWVGEPGYGKSTLLRQIAVLCASALHPFTRVALSTPLRVLYVDCQDSRDDAGEAIGAMVQRARDRYRGTLFVDPMPQGIDLTTPRWQRWLDSRVAKVKADLVILGPLYNAVRGAPGRSKQSEETAELAAAALGDLLVRRDCALMIEAHAPHGDDMRVRGSKMWEDWPAFGFGLVPDTRYAHGRAMDVRRFRGDRYSGREWPTRFVQGPIWPWETSAASTQDGLL